MSFQSSAMLSLNIKVLVILGSFLVTQLRYAVFGNPYLLISDTLPRSVSVLELTDLAAERLPEGVKLPSPDSDIGGDKLLICKARMSRRSALKYTPSGKRTALVPVATSIPWVTLPCWVLCETLAEKGYDWTWESTSWEGHPSVESPKVNQIDRNIITNILDVQMPQAVRMTKNSTRDEIRQPPINSVVTAVDQLRRFIRDNKGAARDIRLTGRNESSSASWSILTNSKIPPQVDNIWEVPTAQHEVSSFIFLGSSKCVETQIEKKGSYLGIESANVMRSCSCQTERTALGEQKSTQREHDLLTVMQSSNFLVGTGLANDSRDLVDDSDSQSLPNRDSASTEDVRMTVKKTPIAARPTSFLPVDPCPVNLHRRSYCPGGLAQMKGSEARQLRTYSRPADKNHSFGLMSEVTRTHSAFAVPPSRSVYQGRPDDGKIHALSASNTLSSKGLLPQGDFTLGLTDAPEIEAVFADLLLESKSQSKKVVVENVQTSSEGPKAHANSNERRRRGSRLDRRRSGRQDYP